MHVYTIISEYNWTHYQDEFVYQGHKGLSEGSQTLKTQLDCNNPILVG